MPLSPARIISFDVLRRVATQQAYADECLRAELQNDIRTEDAGLATELTLGTLRWQRLLDFLIDRNVTKAPKSLDVEVRIALRLGVYQLMFLQRVPAHAAVHESVELVKRARKRSAAPLVNAVLRKAAKEAGHIGRSPADLASLVPESVSSADRLGILYSHPTWLIERWLQTFGEQRTVALLEANNRVPNMSGCLFDSTNREETLVSLTRAGCAVQPGLLLRDALILHGGIPASSEAVRNGRFVIQDEASQAVAQILGVERGNRVLDLCAAPGGKTLILSRAAGAEGSVAAVDLHPARVRAMTERFENAGLRNVTCVSLDGTKPMSFERPFDRVLVDAPCSGTGTLARHPEIRWRVKPEDLEDLHGRQVALLRNALNYLAPHGRLEYSTCSLEPEENELVVRDALSGTDKKFHFVNCSDTVKKILRETVPAESTLGADGFFRTFPAAHATDGFFAAVIEQS